MNNVNLADLKHSALLKKCEEFQNTLREVYAIAAKIKAQPVVKYLEDKDIEPVVTIRVTEEELPKARAKN